MADNYLENRMEAYRSGRLARNSRTSASMRRPARPDSLTLTYPELNVAVTGTTLSPELRATVSALRSVGARVAFACEHHDGNSAMLFAQESGSRFYPADAVPTISRLIDDLVHAWKRLDYLITLAPDSVEINRQDGESSRTVPLPAEASPEAIARLILFLLHPSNASLL